MSNIVTIELGHLIVRTSGEGLWSDAIRTVPLFITVGCDADAIDRNQDGQIEYAHCKFRAHFTPKHWDVMRDGLLYTDTGVLDAINTWLGRLGYRGSVCWSEQGRQEGSFADFDMDYELLHQLFPETIQEIAA